MKRTAAAIVMICAGAGGCAAQEGGASVRLKLDPEMAAQVKVVSFKSAMMGRIVKNAAYSGTEISEHTQMLADGTRIHTEEQVKVFRDNQGRVRRESAREINIWDPVGEVSYSLDPQTLKARKLPFMGGGNVIAGKDGTSLYLRSLQGNGETKQEAETVARAITELKKSTAEISFRLARDGEGGLVQKSDTIAPAADEVSLGAQKFDAVTAEGKRQTSVVAVDTVGNDRPIIVTSERWYSAELSLNVLTRRTDPRSGEDVFRLTNISRVEPTADLFQVPAGYQMVERK